MLSRVTSERNRVSEYLVSKNTFKRLSLSKLSTAVILRNFSFSFSLPIVTVTITTSKASYARSNLR